MLRCCFVSGFALLFFLDTFMDLIRCIATRKHNPFCVLFLPSLTHFGEELTSTLELGLQSPWNVNRRARNLKSFMSSARIFIYLFLDFWLTPCWKRRNMCAMVLIYGNCETVATGYAESETLLIANENISPQIQLLWLINSIAINQKKEKWLKRLLMERN